MKAQGYVSVPLDVWNYETINLYAKKTGITLKSIMSEASNDWLAKNNAKIYAALMRKPYRPQLKPPVQ